MIFREYYTKAMLMADSLNPTRTNILSSKLVRNKLSGWKQMPSLDCIVHNKLLCASFLNDINDSFELCADYDGNIVRNHRVAKVSIDDFIEFFKHFKYEDVPNITRKIVTIQYLNYLKETLGKQHVYLYEMAYNAKEVSNLRFRKVADNKPGNLQAGRDDNGSYPGDREFKCEDSVCIQLHHIRIQQHLHPLNGKDLYNLCLYYPDSLATSFVGVEEDDIENDEY